MKIAEILPQPSETFSNIMSREMILLPKEKYERLIDQTINKKDELKETNMMGEGQANRNIKEDDSSQSQSTDGDKSATERTTNTNGSHVTMTPRDFQETIKSEWRRRVTSKIAQHDKNGLHLNSIV